MRDALIEAIGKERYGIHKKRQEAPESHDGESSRVMTECSKYSKVRRAMI